MRQFLWTRKIEIRLRILERLVIRWNPTINLISSRDIPVLWHRHILDSAQLARFIDRSGGHGIDLGSGAGFPGLVVSLVSQRPFHLVEADQRKAAFLREAARETGADVMVHATRIEDTSITTASLVTARALANLTQLLRLSIRFLGDDGVCLFLKGRTAASELTEARREWQMEVRQHPSDTDPHATILELSRIRHIGAAR